MLYEKMYEEMYEALREVSKELYEDGFNEGVLEIKDVFFNNPATIVFWNDNTKTVVKCQGGEKYDPEKGLAMAIVKKVCGNTREYYEIFKHFGVDK